MNHPWNWDMIPATDSSVPKECSEASWATGFVAAVVWTQTVRGQACRRVFEILNGSGLFKESLSHDDKGKTNVNTALYLHCLVYSKLLLSNKPEAECVCCGNCDMPELMNLTQLFSLICLFNRLGSRGPYDPSGKLKLLKLIYLAFSVKRVWSSSYCSFSYRPN